MLSGIFDIQLFQSSDLYILNTVHELYQGTTKVTIKYHQVELNQAFSDHVLIVSIIIIQVQISLHVADSLEEGFIRVGGIKIQFQLPDETIISTQENDKVQVKESLSLISELINRLHVKLYKFHKFKFQVNPNDKAHVSVIFHQVKDILFAVENFHVDVVVFQ